MKKQFKLTSLKLESFVTKFTSDAEKTINGGGYSDQPGCKYGSLKCSGGGTYYNTYEYGCTDAGGCGPTGPRYTC